MNEKWLVNCVRCGRVIRGERSRLFWGRNDETGVTGTWRTCGGVLEKKCDRLVDEAKREAQRAHASA